MSKEKQVCYLRLHSGDPMLIGINEVTYDGYKPVPITEDDWRVRFRGGGIEVALKPEIGFGLSQSEKSVAVTHVTIWDSDQPGARILNCRELNHLMIIGKGCEPKLQGGGFTLMERAAGGW